MRTVFVTLLLGLALPVLAQSPGDRALPSQTPAQTQGKKPPAAKPFSRGNQQLQPIPEPPPPPPGMELDPALEPQVTIQRRADQTIEEYRLNGRLYMVKVTPSHGKSYYLVDSVGRGDFVRYDSYETGTRPPMWVIHQW
jgi:hypothetical protein